MVIVSMATVLKVACVTMLMIIPTRAQLQPPSFGMMPPFVHKEVQQCWSSFRNVNGCLWEVYGSFINGKVGALGPACCKAITEINTNCWPKMFPFNPYFPPLLKAYCAMNGSQPPITLDSAEDVSSTKVLTIASEIKPEDASLDTFELADPNVGKCLASFQTTQGCTQEIISSFFSFQVRPLGPSCCKALTSIDSNCWPKLFPFNPFFPPLLKNYCAAQGKLIPLFT
ncbi:hypothetical protein AQUCO_04200092v1 [Aquilegia coerulea]|uniref:Prolamin-like domain-containing protein n=1 Tax=Aquilegia coerulea TaxID=218851 RepID=A0A2G5CP63_AQUCA|nr:hypothetical protein AQUCO_04200092v1 [Aquilegia coerulea]